MEIKKLNVYVVKMQNNCGAYIEEVDGFLITSKSVSSLEKELPEALKFHIQALHDYEIQPWMQAQWEFIYHYDICSLLEKYDGIFNQSSFARAVGINDTLMRQYMLGIKKPGKKQILKINSNLHTFAENLEKIIVSST
jgi:hypothetical protein